MNLSQKEKYRQLSETESSIHLPARGWWLDAVAGVDNWDVAIVEKNEEIVAALPYILVQKAWFKIIKMPKLTPGLGLWLKYPDGQKYATKLAYEMKLIDELIDQLPHFHRFHQRFHHGFTNWLPFFWRGFEQTTRYHYIIPDLSNVENVFNNFRDNIRREIRKAQKSLKITSGNDVDKLYDLINLTYARQNLPVDFSKNVLRNIVNACDQRSCQKIFFAEDSDGNLHASLILVWDENMAYYLQGGNHPDLRNSGAASLVMWEAIQFASTVTQQFNFAGSMIPSIERFFRGFGATQVPYFSIYKNNLFFKLWQTFFRENK